MSADVWEAAADHLERFRDDTYGFFPPPTPEFDYAMLDRWLEDTFGFRIDRISADMYRRALTVAATQLRDRAADERDADV